MHRPVCTRLWLRVSLPMHRPVCTLMTVHGVLAWGAVEVARGAFAHQSSLRPSVPSLLARRPSSRRSLAPQPPTNVGLFVRAPTTSSFVPVPLTALSLAPSKSTPLIPAVPSQCLVLIVFGWGGMRTSTNTPRYIKRGEAMLFVCFSGLRHHFESQLFRRYRVRMQTFLYDV